jgi:signal transduction histidine kinase
VRAVQATPLLTRTGRLVGVIATHFRKVHIPHEPELRIIDIHTRQAADMLERMGAQEEQQRLESQLRHVHKMEAIGTLAGGVAQDFNNMLAAIIGFTEMALDDVADNPDVQHKMEQVLKAGLRVAGDETSSSRFLHSAASTKENEKRSASRL